MKPKQNRLQLKKQAVANLTSPELNSIKGGAEDAWTTSKRHCTGFLCCEPQPTAAGCIPTMECLPTMICTTLL